MMLYHIMVMESCFALIIIISLSALCRLSTFLNHLAACSGFWRGDSYKNLLAKKRNQQPEGYPLVHAASCTQYLGLHAQGGEDIG